MNASPLSLRMRLRVGIRTPVGLWKQWREARLAAAAPHELAICAIFREEASILNEWIEFHAAVGVTQFYLYNNFSTDEFRDVLRPWIERGLVTLTEWPVLVGQVAAYTDCLRRFRNEARWIAFIDVDEFLFSPCCVDIRPILASFSDFPGLEVWQLFFGANGHIQRPTGSAVDCYTRRAPISQTTVKTIANPRMVYKARVHQFKYWRGGGLDTSGRAVGPSSTPVLDVLRINHYWSRSVEELKIKISRGDASSSDLRQQGWHFEFEKSLNSEIDHTIQSVVAEIRKRAQSAPAELANR